MDRQSFFALPSLVADADVLCTSTAWTFLKRRLFLLRTVLSLANARPCVLLCSASKLLGRSAPSVASSSTLKGDIRSRTSTCLAVCWRLSTEPSSASPTAPNRAFSLRFDGVGGGVIGAEKAWVYLAFVMVGRVDWYSDVLIVLSKLARLVKIDVPGHDQSELEEMIPKGRVYTRIAGDGSLTDW